MKTTLRIFAMAAMAAICTLTAGQEPVGANVIFVGNSITYGYCLDNPAVEAPPMIVKELLESHNVGQVEIANLGVTGSTTTDWLPQSGKHYKTLVEQADKMASEDKPLIFSISLGANDSAAEGKANAPLTAEAYGANMQTIIDSLTTRYKKCSVVVNHPIWYSDNTYDNVKYLAEGQKRLSSYREVLTDMVAQFRAKDRRQVFLGDTEGWDTFANQTQFFVQEEGQAGVFNLHPNREGARLLAQLWEKHIYNVWRLGAPEHITLEGGAEMLLYKAPNPTSDKAVVLCPGGAYMFLVTDNEGTEIAHWLSSNGITAAVLLYHMPRGNSQLPLSDAEQAIATMHKNADKWGKYTKVGIMGSSAGGHLASTAATHLMGDTKPDFQILLYPVVSMADGVTHNFSRMALLGTAPTAQDIESFSNELQVTESTPPAFIALSADDGLVPPANSFNYAQALIAKGVKTSLHVYPIGDHGWGWADWFYYKKNWTEELLRWLSE